MSTLLGGIGLFVLGYVANELIAVPTLVIVACALVAQVGILILNAKKRGGK